MASRERLMWTRVAIIATLMISVPFLSSACLATAAILGAGELAEHFDEYALVRGDRIIARAKTYRGLGHSFLG